ncbi:mucosal pentraxin-like [Phyllobates terribilis]|uniref:mucosal pentraxin-like n=1 Tax=Phyllobates terribilis TaxID=111132 RepID=UPI003CCB375D
MGCEMVYKRRIWKQCQDWWDMGCEVVYERMIWKQSQDWLSPVHVQALQLSPKVHFPKFCLMEDDTLLTVVIHEAIDPREKNVQGQGLVGQDMIPTWGTMVKWVIIAKSYLQSFRKLNPIKKPHRVQEHILQIIADEGERGRKVRITLFIMKKILCLFVFASVPGILGQIDMTGKAFSFYERRTDSLKIIPAAKTFSEFTTCLKSCTNLNENNLLVLLLSKDNSTRFLVLFFSNPEKPGVHILIHYNNFAENFQLSDSKTWIDICVTFSFCSGKLVVFLNGKEHKILGLGRTKQNHVTAQTILLGKTKAYPNTDVAQITNFNIWSSALTKRDIERFAKQNRGGDIINWRSVLFESDHAISIEQPRCSTKDIFTAK